MDSKTYRVMALAAICQAVELVRLIARKATDPHETPAFDQQLKVMYHSITVVDADNPSQIYDSMQNLTLGYQTLCRQLNNQAGKNVELTHYIIGILALERKLNKRAAALTQLSERIDGLKRQLSHFDLLDENIIANIAAIYTEVISPLGNRIQITGSPEALQIQSNQQKIRALLLSAIRAAVLWRQMGGKKRHLLFSRQDILTVAQHSLKVNQQEL